MTQPSPQELVAEVDAAAQGLKEIIDSADGEPNDEQIDQMAKHAVKGVAALTQLAARALSLRARP